MKNIPVMIKRGVHLFSQKVYKNRADISFFGGIALTMLGTGLFVKATADIQPKLNDHKAAMNVLDMDEEEKTRPEEVIKKERKMVNKGTAKAIVKAYAVPVTVSVVGYGLELYSHRELKSDLAAVSVTLNSITAAYEALKSKMNPDELAEAQGVHVQTDENGEKSVFFDLDEIGKDPTTMMFDASNPNYNENKGSNKTWLKGMQESENMILEFGDYSWRFLWQVLADLKENPKIVAKIAEKYPKAGWVFGKTERIDFGLYSQDWATVRFMDEIEPSVLLRFNCVPNIYEYI